MHWRRLPLGLATPDHTVPYGTALSRDSRHFVPGYHRTVPLGHFATGFSQGFMREHPPDCQPEQSSGFFAFSGERFGRQNVVCDLDHGSTESRDFVERADAVWPCL